MLSISHIKLNKKDRNKRVILIQFMKEKNLNFRNLKCCTFFQNSVVDVDQKYQIILFTKHPPLDKKITGLI